MNLQAVCDRARLALNDDAKERHPDADLLTYCQEGLGTLLDLRPDLFIGQFSTFNQESLTLTSNFPIERRYVPLLIDYIIFRCERIDNEGAGNLNAVVAVEWFQKRLA